MRGIRFLGLVGALVLSGCTGTMPKGSERSLYTVADVLEVHRADLAKSIQLRLNQKILFDLDQDPDQPGEWGLVDYDNRVMILLSDSPRLPPGDWGVLLEGRALGYGQVTVKFIPTDDSLEPKTYTMDVSIKK